MKDALLISCVKTSDVLACMRRSVDNFIAKQDGVTAIEYAVIAVAVTTALTAVFGGEGTFTTALQEKFAALTRALQ